MKKTLLLSAITPLLLFTLPKTVNAYSVLTHEAIIDACWESSILPLLRHKYPMATSPQLLEAHAYTYGGAIMPDMGYYPFGSKFFTNLIHYVRTGDFVETLLSESHDLNEFAFALGALCHYNADVYGHSIGVNPAVPLVYPETRKYGKVVTYAEDKIAHLRMEFGYDVLQIARGNYASANYHDFIGFQVASDLLDRTFNKVYGLSLSDVFGDYSLALGTFRWTVKTLFPIITKAAWSSKKKQIRNANPGLTAKKFIYKMHRVNYYHDFGKKDTRPGITAKILSVLITIIPKVGPLRALNFAVPGPDAEKLFAQSFDTVVTHYKAEITRLGTDSIYIVNRNLDTGNKTDLHEYSLTDKTYRKLLLVQQKIGFNYTPPELTANLRSYYKTGSTSKPNSPKDQKLAKALAQLNLPAASNLPE